MANNFLITEARRNEMLDALSNDFDNGYLRIYSGSQPATPDTALSGQTLLAELRFNATAFGAAAAGVITANAFTSDASANATGTAAWFRALKSDGTTALCDGTVGTVSTDLIIDNTAISSGVQVSCSAFTIAI
jgi:hypothetical protein